MNLFFTDLDPGKAAAEQPDQYVIKIAIEVTLFLSAVVWRHGYEGPIGTDEQLRFEQDTETSFRLLPAAGPYMNSKIVRPASEIYEWLSRSIQNYRWGLAYGMGLVKEYSRRYGKIHRSESVLLWLIRNEPRLPDIGLTLDVGLAMPDQYKDKKDPVKSYRHYMICEKSRFIKWQFCDPPKWYSDGIRNKDRFCKQYYQKGKILEELRQANIATEKARKLREREEKKKLKKRLESKKKRK